MANNTLDRITIAELRGGVYNHSEHATLGDKGHRRYNPYSFDFDSTPLSLQEPGAHWSDEAKKGHLERRELAIARLKEQYGTRHHDTVVRNVADLGAKPMSIVAYHNEFHQQAREAFVIGSYYPALVAACALGERILNHLILDLRADFTTSPHYKKVYNKDSFDDWPRVVAILSEWGVIDDKVAETVLELGRLRNRSIHFNPETYTALRDDALSALRSLGSLISQQFGYFGGQRWFMLGTLGAAFVSKSFESHPFVRTYIIPRSGFVGPLYGMELRADGYWQHLDYSDYGDGDLSDEEFAKAQRERDPKRVVTREMIDQSASAGNEKPQMDQSSESPP